MTDNNLYKFEGLFRELFRPLCGFAMKYVKDQDDAKNLVHDAFLGAWEKFETLPPDTNYRSYLYTTVRNKSLNAIRDRKKMEDLRSIPEARLAEEDQSLEVSELQKKIELGIQSLPEKCRIIFEMNRGEGLKYTQIAEKLGISVKTVEAQMSKALTVLREHLKEFLSLLILMLSS